MIDLQEIYLSTEELSACLDFSRKSAPNQQSIEFGQNTTKPRSVGEIARDNLIGKIAEVAFSKILKENYDIDVPLDFNYYPRGQWDDQDTIINGWRIDVKGTRRGGHWMLIEWNKLNFRQQDHKLSHVFVMFSVDWNRDYDKPTGLVRFEGIASLQKLRPGVETTLILKKGTIIPGTRAHLQADNYGIHFRNLYHDFDGFVKFVLDQTPPDDLTDQYPNPYTGKMVREHELTKGNVKECNVKECNVKESDVKENPKIIPQDSSCKTENISKESHIAVILNWLKAKLHFIHRH